MFSINRRSNNSNDKTQVDDNDSNGSDENSDENSDEDYDDDEEI